MEKRAVNVRNGHGSQDKTKGRDEVISLEDVGRRMHKLRDEKRLENEL